jgi:3-hydroxyacyl-[acyl-carrier-protein] dehydratase
MYPEALEELIRDLKRLPLQRAAGTAHTVNYGVQHLSSVLPHRAPFLLIDGIGALDLMDRSISGHRTIRGDDPVLAGHLPGAPTYPGVLQVEMMSQMGLALVHFLKRGTHLVRDDARPIRARTLRIHHAAYLTALVPGDHVQVQARVIEQDAMTATLAGQLLKEDVVVSLAVQEYYLTE